MKRMFFMAMALAAGTVFLFAETETMTPSVSPTVTETVTQTASETVTETVMQTASETVTETVAQTASETVTETVTQTASEMVTETATQTASFSATETITPVITVTFTLTQSPTVTSTETLPPTSTPVDTPEIGAGIFEMIEGMPYPNPGKAGADVYVLYNLDNPGRIVLEIYTVDGRKVLTEDKGVLFGQGKLALNISNLAPGIYFMRYRVSPEGGAAAIEKMSRFLLKR